MLEHINDHIEVFPNLIFVIFSPWRFSPHRFFPHKFRTKTAYISIKLHKLFKNFYKIKNFSTWQIFLHRYNLWYLWQIWGLALVQQKSFLHDPEHSTNAPCIQMLIINQQYLLPSHIMLFSRHMYIFDELHIFVGPHTHMAASRLAK